MHGRGHGEGGKSGASGRDRPSTAPPTGPRPPEQHGQPTRLYRTHAGAAPRGRRAAPAASPARSGGQQHDGRSAHGRLRADREAGRQPAPEARTRPPNGLRSQHRDSGARRFRGSTRRSRRSRPRQGLLLRVTPPATSDRRRCSRGKRFQPRAATPREPDAPPPPHRSRGPGATTGLRTRRPLTLVREPEGVRSSSPGSGGRPPLRRVDACLPTDRRARSPYGEGEHHTTAVAASRRRARRAGFGTGHPRQVGGRDPAGGSPRSRRQAHLAHRTSVDRSVPSNVRCHIARGA